MSHRFFSRFLEFEMSEYIPPEKRQKTGEDEEQQLLDVRNQQDELDELNEKAR